MTELNPVDAMTTTDYRAMCAELFVKLKEWDSSDPYHDCGPLLCRARALLDQPVAEVPTDEELMELMPQQMRDDLAAAARALTGDMPWPDNSKAAAACRIILNRHAVDHARAVLARWGRPTPQPVAVSERLPGPGDCDEQGRCWMFGNVEGDWRLISTINPGIPKLKYCFSHWLPANALPTPEATND